MPDKASSGTKNFFINISSQKENGWDLAFSVHYGLIRVRSWFDLPYQKAMGSTKTWREYDKFYVSSQILKWIVSFDIFQARIHDDIKHSM